MGEVANSPRVFASRRFFVLALLVLAILIVLIGVASHGSLPSIHLNVRTILTIIGSLGSLVGLWKLVSRWLRKRQTARAETATQQFAAPKSKPHRFGLRDLWSVFLASLARKIAFSRLQSEDNAKRKAWEKAQQSAQPQGPRPIGFVDQLRYFSLFVLTGLANWLRPWFQPKKTNDATAAISPRDSLLAQRSREAQTTRPRFYMPGIPAVVHVAISTLLIGLAMFVISRKWSLWLFASALIFFVLAVIRVVRVELAKRRMEAGQDESERGYNASLDRANVPLRNFAAALLGIATLVGFVSNSGFPGTMGWTICPLIAWWLFNPRKSIVKVCASIVWGGMWLVVLLAHLTGVKQ
jgi:membrane protein implicated in regulation of membrane protease activity